MRGFLQFRTSSQGPWQEFWFLLDNSVLLAYTDDQACNQTVDNMQGCYETSQMASILLRTVRRDGSEDEDEDEDGSPGGPKLQVEIYTKQGQHIYLKSRKGENLREWKNALMSAKHSEMSSSSLMTISRSSRRPPRGPHHQQRRHRDRTLSIVSTTSNTVVPFRAQPPAGSGGAGLAAPLLNKRKSVSMTSLKDGIDADDDGVRVSQTPRIQIHDDDDDWDPDNSEYDDDDVNLCSLGRFSSSMASIDSKYSSMTLRSRSRFNYSASSAAHASAVSKNMWRPALPINSQNLLQMTERHRKEDEEEEEEERLSQAGDRANHSSVESEPSQQADGDEDKNLPQPTSSSTCQNNADDAAATDMTAATPTSTAVSDDGLSRAIKPPLASKATELRSSTEDESSAAAGKKKKKKRPVFIRMTSGAFDTMRRMSLRKRKSRRKPEPEEISPDLPTIPSPGLPPAPAPAAEEAEKVEEVVPEPIIIRPKYVEAPAKAEEEQALDGAGDDAPPKTPTAKVKKSGSSAGDRLSQRVKSLPRKILARTASFRRSQTAEDEGEKGPAAEAAQSGDAVDSAAATGPRRRQSKHFGGAALVANTDGELKAKLRKWKESADTDSPVFTGGDDTGGSGGGGKVFSFPGKKSRNSIPPNLPQKPAKFKSSQLQSVLDGKLNPPKSKKWSAKDIRGMLNVLKVQMMADGRNKKIDREKLNRLYDEPRCLDQTFASQASVDDSEQVVLRRRLGSRSSNV